jgi:hypothetical protein
MKQKRYDYHTIVMSMLNRSEKAGFPEIASQMSPDRRVVIALSVFGVLGATGAAFAAALALLPPLVALPAVGLGLVVAAAMLAVIALTAPVEIGRTRVVFWDIAGALACIGLCACGLAESEPVLALLNQER